METKDLQRLGTEKCKVVPSVTVNLWISGGVPMVSYSLTFRRFYSGLFDFISISLIP